MRFRRYFKKCSNCNTRLIFRAEDDTGNIWSLIIGDYCIKCNKYEFSYTIDKVLFDKTIYAVKILQYNKLTQEHKKKLSEVKKGKGNLYKGKASKINSILADLQSHNIAYEIIPPYPYPVITKPKELNLKLSDESLTMWYDKNMYEIEIPSCESIDFEQIILDLNQKIDEYTFSDQLILKVTALNLFNVIYYLEYEKVEYHLLFQNPYPGLLKVTIKVANGNRCIREIITQPEYSISFMYHKASY